MASDKELRGWVSDQLHSLVGFSDRTVADFVLASAKKAKDPSSLLNSLAAFGVPAGSSGQAFAEGVLARLPRASKGPSAAQLQQQQARQLVKRSRKYGLLDDEDDADEPAPAAKPPQPSQQQQQQQQDRDAGGSRSGTGSTKQQRAHRRAAGQYGSEGDDQEADPTPRLLAQQQQQQYKRRRKWEEDEEEDERRGGSSSKRGGGDAAAAAAAAEVAAEAQREADQREKEEFEARWVGRLYVSAVHVHVLQCMHGLVTVAVQTADNEG
jgi:pre-mRNA-splicing factor ATP-dependent RNA helicase DHX16